MSNEKRRFYNPVTLIIECVTPAYAAAVGLVEWSGPSDECEVDKADVERAVLPVAEPDVEPVNYASLSKPDLLAAAADAGVDTTGTKADILARLDSTNFTATSADGEL